MSGLGYGMPIGSIGAKGVDMSPYMQLLATQKREQEAQAQLAQRDAQMRLQAQQEQDRLAAQQEYQRGSLRLREREGDMQSEQNKATLALRAQEEAGRGARQQAGFEAQKAADERVSIRAKEADERREGYKIAGEERGVEREVAREGRAKEDKKTERERAVGIADYASKFGSDLTNELRRRRDSKREGTFQHYTPEKAYAEYLEQANTIADPETRLAAREAVREAYEGFVKETEEQALKAEAAEDRRINRIRETEEYERATKESERILAERVTPEFRRRLAAEIGPDGGFTPEGMKMILEHPELTPVVKGVMDLMRGDPKKDAETELVKARVKGQQLENKLVEGKLGGGDKPTGTLAASGALSEVEQEDYELHKGLAKETASAPGNVTGYGLVTRAYEKLEDVAGGKSDTNKAAAKDLRRAIELGRKLGSGEVGGVFSDTEGYSATGTIIGDIFADDVALSEAEREELFALITSIENATGYELVD